MKLAVQTKNLTKLFGEFKAVDRVNIQVQRGTLYGFLGPNGAGKSTTIKMLTGIVSPSAGAVQILGHNPWDKRDAIKVKRKIGVVPEDLALFDNLTAREYLNFVGRMYLLDKATIVERSDQLLDALKLEGIEKKLTVEYSHGMKKKLAMAAAMLPNPELLCLDEPFEGIDAITSSVIRDILLGFVAKGGTVFVTSHVLEIIERICTHVGIITGGHLVEQSSLSDLKQNGSLESRFLEIVGCKAETNQNLNWLDARSTIESELVSRHVPQTPDDESTQ